MSSSSTRMRQEETGAISPLSGRFCIRVRSGCEHGWTEYRNSGREHRHSRYGRCRRVLDRWTLPIHCGQRSRWAECWAGKHVRAPGRWHLPRRPIYQRTDHRNRDCRIDPPGVTNRTGDISSCNDCGSDPGAADAGGDPALPAGYCPGPTGTATSAAAWTATGIEPTGRQQR